MLAIALIALTTAISSVVLIRVTSNGRIDRMDRRLESFVNFIVDNTSDTGQVSQQVQQFSFADSVVGLDRSTSLLFVGEFIDGSLVTLLRPPDETDRMSQLTISESTAQELARTETETDARIAGDGSTYRVTARIDPRGRTFVFGLSRDAIDREGRSVMIIASVAFGLIIVTLGVVAWWVLQLGVEPIRRMTSTAKSISEGHLEADIPVYASGTEAGELGSSLASMLATIRSSLDAKDRTEQQLRRFIADVSHELRTPLTTIRGYAELYRSGGLRDPESLESAMARTEAEADRMGRLVEDLLLIERLDQGMEREHGVCALDEIIDAQVADFEARYPDHRIDTMIDTATVVGDCDQLVRVVVNLLQNAVDHGGIGKVSLSLSRDPHQAVLAVDDQGPGMDAEQIARAFDRFYRADSSRKRDPGGSGLGLAIVKAIVDSHGGTVRIESPVPSTQSGTRVTLTLPCDN